MSIMQFIENCQDMCGAAKHAGIAQKAVLKNTSGAGFNINDYSEQNIANMAHDLDGVQNAKTTQNQQETKRKLAARGGEKDNISAFLAQLDSLEYQLKALNKVIADMEAGFDAKYGQNWREDLAGEILDPDIFPQQHEGESLEDYRDRIEEALISEMLNADGTIKDEYLNHPEYGEFALWARREYLRNEATQKAENLKEIYEDPDSTEEQKQQASLEAEEAALEVASELGSPDLVLAVEEELDIRKEQHLSNAAFNRLEADSF